ncbi:MAG: cell filamentation protein Fic, partial [Algoriphagus sp.]
MEDFQFSKSVTVFHGRAVPEEGYLTGYSAIIDVFGIQIPLPNKLVLISSKNRTYEKQSWRVFPFRYLPENNLYKHLVFAIKYEGLNLLFFKKLFEIIDNKEIISLVKAEPNGQYARRIWFLFEWLTGVNLPIPDLEKGNYVELLDEKIQFSIGSGIKSQRHRVTNNLPGTREFCPLVFKTKKLENYIDKRLSAQTEHIIQGVRKDFLQRAAAFLLLKDSKASFSIEGESPKSKRAARWGQALGQAGMKSLSKEELYRLQQLVIENPRFMVLGYRQKGGFVGEHDRVSGEPLPDHISAKWEDIEFLMEGLLDTEKILIDESFDPVVAATVIAFGMV